MWLISQTKTGELNHDVLLDKIIHTKKRYVVGIF